MGRGGADARNVAVGRASRQTFTLFDRAEYFLLNLICKTTEMDCQSIAVASWNHATRSARTREEKHDRQRDHGRCDAARMGGLIA
jgi:hypothetical protein